jgi:hypothetical protein
MLLDERDKEEEREKVKELHRVSGMKRSESIQGAIHRETWERHFNLYRTE